MFVVLLDFMVIWQLCIRVQDLRSMAKIQPVQIKYYGSIYEGSPNFLEATNRILEKVKNYYKDHQAEISEYGNSYIFDLIDIKDFVGKFL